MTRKNWLFLLVVSSAAVYAVFSYRHFSKVKSAHLSTRVDSLNDKLMRLYTNIDRQGTYEVISKKEVAEQFISRKFFVLKNGTWEPNTVPYGTDYGLAMSLRSVAGDLQLILDKLRQAIPKEGVYLCDRGHHVTVHHLCNSETITKRSVDIPSFNKKLLEGFLPKVAAVLDRVPNANLTITFRMIVVGPSDGSIIMVGTADPAHLLPEVRQDIWDAFKELGLPSLRSSPWEIIHTTIGRLLPATSEDPRMYLSEAHYTALRGFIDTYNALPPSQQLRVTVNFKESLSFMHNKLLFSMETFHDIPVRSLHSGAPQLQELIDSFKAEGAINT